MSSYYARPMLPRSPSQRLLRWLNDQAQALVITAAIGLALFFLVDYAGGDTHYYQGTVVGREYQEAYWSRDCSTDSKTGQETCTDTYHPAEYYAQVTDAFGQERITLTAARYYTLHEGQKMALRCQYGYYTGWRYGGSCDE